MQVVLCAPSGPTEKQYPVHSSLKYLWSNLLHLCHCSVEISSGSYWSSLISSGVLGFKCTSCIVVFFIIWHTINTAAELEFPQQNMLQECCEEVTKICLTYSKSLKKTKQICQIIWHFLPEWAEGLSSGWLAGLTGWRGEPVWTLWSAAWPGAKSCT